MRAIVRTEWHNREGGYWEAQAYTADGERLPSLYATMVHERAAVGELIGTLICEGYTEIVCQSHEPISLTVEHRAPGLPVVIF